jgi:hypothetical protein
VVEILSYNPKKETYKIRFEGQRTESNWEGGNEIIDIIFTKELRDNKCFKMS